MTTENYYTKQKQIYFKAFQHLSHLENALKCIKREGIFNSQISILGKTTQFFEDKEIEISDEFFSIKKYWKNQLGHSVNFGSFYNPQIGTIFIVGSLASTFLHKINGKPLAALSSGSYGIFRGIGASKIEASAYLKLLNRGNFLLVFRGFENELHQLENLLQAVVE
mgnify:CR=1 FL=1